MEADRNLVKIWLNKISYLGTGRVSSLSLSLSSLYLVNAREEGEFSRIETISDKNVRLYRFCEKRDKG